MKPVDFQAEFDATLSSGISAERFESYADEALTGLINLVDEAKSTYDRQPTTAHRSEKELEDAVFNYFRLGTVESKLAYIASLAEDIRKIGDFVMDITPSPSVIIPPAPIENPIANGKGEFETKKMFSRVQTILFLLQNDFNIDIYDAHELRVKSGVLSKKSMRGASYFSLDALPIARTIFACNEEGNVTYVFDRNYMDEVGISTEDLSGLEKPLLDELIAEFSALGSRIVYSSEFVSRLRAALSTPLSEVPLIDPQEMGDDNYLYAPAPEDYKSAYGIAKQYGISQDSVYKAVATAAADLGVIEKYRMGNHVTPGYSPEQQSIIYETLVFLRIIVEDLPDSHIRKSDFAEKYGISEGTLAMICKELADELGEIKTFKFDARKTSAFSPEQQSILMTYLGQNGYFLENPPEDFASIKEFSEYLGISQRTLTSHLNDVNDLGEVRLFRREGTGVRAYMISPRQQRLIEATFEALGLLTDKPPEGVCSATDLQQRLGITRATIQTAIDTIRDHLGEIKNYKFSGRITEGFNETQQRMITDQLAERGFFNLAPEGYLSAKAFADKLRVDHQTVRRIAKKLREDEAFGPVERYKTKAQVTECYTPAQQGMIEEVLKQESGNGLPEGIMNMFEFSKKIGLNYTTVYTAVQELKNVLPDIREYRHANGRMVVGLNEAHRRVILEWLEANDRFAEPVPDGFLSVKAMTRVFGISEKPIRKAVAELGDAMGEIKRYKIRGIVTEALSPSQVERIGRYLEEKGYFLEEAPAGIVSKRRLAKELHTSENKILALAEQIESFGEVKRYKFNGNISEGFDERQRQALSAYLDNSL